MENRNGQGIFYGVIGVATLVVAIIGATFAYFSAAGNTDATTINGTTGQGGGLTLTVTKLSTDATGPLIPQLESTLADALAGTSNKSCVDGKGNTVCQVYSIVVKNTGSSTVSVPGTLTLTSEATHMKWRKMTDATTLGTNTSVGQGTKGAIDTPTLQAAGTTGGADSATYYVIVWLEETNSPQASDENKSFTGTVTFELAEGTGVTSTFTAG